MPFPVGHKYCGSLDGSFRPARALRERASSPRHRDVAEKAVLADARRADELSSSNGTGPAAESLCPTHGIGIFIVSLASEIVASLTGRPLAASIMRTVMAESAPTGTGLIDDVEAIVALRRTAGTCDDTASDSHHESRS